MKHLGQFLVSLVIVALFHLFSDPLDLIQAIDCINDVFNSFAYYTDCSTCNADNSRSSPNPWWKSFFRNKINLESSHFFKYLEIYFAPASTFITTVFATSTTAPAALPVKMLETAQGSAIFVFEIQKKVYCILFCILIQMIKFSFEWWISSYLMSSIYAGPEQP